MRKATSEYLPEEKKIQFLAAMDRSGHRAQGARAVLLKPGFDSIISASTDAARRQSLCGHKYPVKPAQLSGFK